MKERDAKFYNDNLKQYLSFIEDELSISFMPIYIQSKAVCHYFCDDTNTFDVWDMYTNNQEKKDVLKRCTQEMLKYSRFKNPAFSFRLLPEEKKYGIALHEQLLPGEELDMDKFKATSIKINLEEPWK